MAVLTHIRPWPWLWFIIPFQQNNRILQTKQWWFFAPSFHGNRWLRHSFRDNYHSFAFSNSRRRLIAWCHTVMHSPTLFANIGFNFIAEKLFFLLIKPAAVYRKWFPEEVLFIKGLTAANIKWFPGSFQLFWVGTLGRFLGTLYFSFTCSQESPRCSIYALYMLE